MPSEAAKRPLSRSLRFRLMIWNAIVVMTTACVMLVALREGVRFTLVRELDQMLQEDLNEIAISLRAKESLNSIREQLDRKVVGRAAHQWFAEIVAADGQVLYGNENAPPTALAERRAQSIRTVGDWRLANRVLSGSPGVSICVGASLSLIQADMRRLDRFVVLAALGVLLVAPLGGYWLAGRATRPLAKIIETTARLRPSQLNERLEIRGTGDELDQLSIKINRLLDRIGKYLQERRDFLANSAHELRTPLAAIRSSIEVALSGGRTNQEYEELLTEILEESGSLELLVNQLLLLSETEAERLKVDKQEVAFDQLIEKALDMFGGVAEYREIQLLCPALPPAIVQGNEQHLRQVVYNLLDNALKFTPALGRVSVQLQVDESSDAIVFSVQDNGPGIPRADLPHVFDRFFQGNRPRSSTGDRRGTGLGLSICQSIVRAHEGTITVDSRMGEGTRFTVRLPRANADATAGGSDVPPLQLNGYRTETPPANESKEPNL